MNSYVGDLTNGVAEAQLKGLFEEFGIVSKASSVADKLSGKSTGFGFIGMDKQSEENQAVKQLDGCSVDGRNLAVNLARPRSERSSAGSKHW